MARDNKVEIEIILKGAQAAKELKGFSKDAAHGLKQVKDEAKDAAKGLKDAGEASGGLGKALDGLRSAAIVTAAAFAAWKGLKEVVGFLKDAGEEAAGQELALKSLHTTIVANKRAYGDFERQIIAQAEAMQKLTGFTDDAVESAARILAPYDNITNDLFPRTLQATADLARALGVDLPSAAQIMGMASLGMTRGLKQIGIDVDDAAFKTIGFAGVLEQVESKVKGQADAYRTTSKGLSDYIKTMWGEVKEQFGVIVNQVLDPFKKAAGEVLTVLADELSKWTKTVDLKQWAAQAAANLKDLALKAIPDLIAKLNELVPKIKDSIIGIGNFFKEVEADYKALKTTLEVIHQLIAAISFGPRGASKAGQAAKLVDDYDKVKDKVEEAKDAAEDPIKTAVDNTMAGRGLDELYKWWAEEKARIEREPIKIRIVRETITSGEGTTSEYGYQSGGLIGGGYGGGDRVPIRAEPGEFMMRKEAVRSLGVDVLNTLNRDAGTGGQKGYIVVDFRLGQKSFPIIAKKEKVLDALLEELQSAELTRG